MQTTPSPEPRKKLSVQAIRILLNTLRAGMKPTRQEWMDAEIQLGNIERENK